MILFRRKDCRVAAHPQSGVIQVSLKETQILKHEEHHANLVSCRVPASTASLNVARVTLQCIMTASLPSICPLKTDPPPSLCLHSP